MIARLCTIMCALFSINLEAGFYRETNFSYLVSSNQETQFAQRDNNFFTDFNPSDEAMPCTIDPKAGFSSQAKFGYEFSSGLDIAFEYGSQKYDNGTATDTALCNTSEYGDSYASCNLHNIAGDSSGLWDHHYTAEANSKFKSKFIGLTIGKNHIVGKHNIKLGYFGGVKYFNTKNKTKVKFYGGDSPDLNHSLSGIFDGKMTLEEQYQTEYEGYGPQIGFKAQIPFGKTGLYFGGGGSASVTFGKSTTTSKYHDMLGGINSSLGITDYDGDDNVSCIVGGGIGGGYDKCHGTRPTISKSSTRFSADISAHIGYNIFKNMAVNIGYQASYFSDANESNYTDRDWSNLNKPSSELQQSDSKDKITHGPTISFSYRF